MVKPPSAKKKLKIKKTNPNGIKFYEMLVGMEAILLTDPDPMAPYRLIDKNEFLQLRAKIIEFFDPDNESKFTGEFGDEVEFGDISDAVRAVTFALYARTTEMTKMISLKERQVWCKKILEMVDVSANS